MDQKIGANMESPNEKVALRYSDNTVRSFSGIEIQPADELTPLKAAPIVEAGREDDVDFSSGFTEQYRREYGNKNDIIVPKNDDYVWYRDPKALAIVVMLLLTFFTGSILLVMLVFTRNPWKIAVITLGYLVIAFVLIFMQVKTAIVR